MPHSEGCEALMVALGKVDAGMVTLVLVMMVVVGIGGML
jgi:hypothetical protein